MTDEKFMATTDALMDLSVGDDAALRRVAELLREREPDPQLLQGLANMIDPDRPGWMGVQLVVKRTSDGRPRRRRNVNLAHFLTLHAIVFEDNKVEAVIAAAMQRFGVQRSTAFEVLREEREYWNARPDNLRLYRADAMKLRELGEADYQTI